jgi:hypothetical protein
MANKLFLGGETVFLWNVTQKTAENCLGMMYGMSTGCALLIRV